MERLLIAVSPGLQERAPWGFWRYVRRGLFIGGVYTMLAVAVGDEAGRGLALSLEEVVTVNLLGGALGGAVVGLLSPYAKSAVACVLIGQAALTPAYALVASFAPELPVVPLVAVILSFGGGLGLVGWYRYGGR